MESPLDRKSWLPREGFHADVLGRIIRITALNPLLTLPLYAYFAYVPRGAQIARENPAYLKYTRILAVLSAIRAINNYLDRRVLNNASFDRFDWNREVVLVTGGSDGIGARIVQGLASRHIKTVVLDVQPLTYTRPPGVYYYGCDITDPSAVQDVAQQIRESLGAPTILINNAGVCRGRHLLDTSEEDVKLTFEVNALSHYRLARELVPNMVRLNHGMVVTVASSAAWVTAPQMTEYAASKAAALSFHEGLSLELATYYNAPKVRTVVVCPGFARTSLFEGFGIKSDAFVGPPLHVDTVAEAVLRQVLSGRSGRVIVPGVYNFNAANFRSLPWWLQHGLMKGGGQLMKDWKGRQVLQKGLVERASGIGAGLGKKE